MQHFTCLADVPDPMALVHQAIALKAQGALANRGIGQGKTMALLFLNPSLRTRLSTQKAATNLGMDSMVMNLNNEGWAIEMEDGTVMNTNKAEHIKEAAPVIASYADVIGIRSFPTLVNRQQDEREEVLNAFIKYAGKPIISLESALRHPLQSLTDVMTITELWQQHPDYGKRAPKIVLTWAPHVRALPQAVPNSFAEWVLGTGHALTIAHPPGYALDPQFTAGASITQNQDEALAEADFVYAKNWSSLEQYGHYLPGFESWQVTQHKMNLTNQAFFMHCLPVRRNVVVSDAVLDSVKSVVVEQAANRTFAAQSVLLSILQSHT